MSFWTVFALYLGMMELLRRNIYGEQIFLFLYYGDFKYNITRKQRTRKIGFVCLFYVNMHFCVI